VAVNAIMAKFMGDREFLEAFDGDIGRIHDPELIAGFYQHSGNAADGVGLWRRKIRATARGPGLVGRTRRDSILERPPLSAIRRSTVAGYHRFLDAGGFSALSVSPTMTVRIVVIPDQ
jgi:hypothetical protein